MRALRRRGGQIVIPAMLIFPALMLFVFLIYETAKLSREKIRHQFAMDAAAFVEMTNYSDFLNRTAYVNGAFPMRIFDEAFGGDYLAENRGKLESAEKVTYAYLLFNNGVFPHKDGTYPPGPHTGESDMTGNKWEIKYGGAGDVKNDPDPTLPEPIRFTTEKNVKEYWIHKDLTYDFFKLYIQIYSLLGSVESAQYTVLKRLAGDHSFMRKSYWLNTGEPEGDLLVASFRSSSMPDFTSGSVVKGKCQHKLDYCGFSVSKGLQLETPECIMGTGGAPAYDLDTMVGDTGCKDLHAGSGLFQFVSISDDKLKPMMTSSSDSGYPGIALRMHWAIPKKNYWNVDLASDMAQRFQAGTLHTTIALTPKESGGPQAAVWPNPTPKFQVRQFP